MTLVGNLTNSLHQTKWHKTSLATVPHTVRIVVFNVTRHNKLLSEIKNIFCYSLFLNTYKIGIVHKKMIA